MTEVPGTSAAQGGTPGTLLAAARTSAGLGVPDVAAQMRISARQVEAIEADRYGELPGPVFVRGFVRNYARLLNLDPAPLLHALEPALGDDTPLRAQHYAGALPMHDRRGHTRAWLALFIVLMLGVLGAAGYEYWRSRTNEVGGQPAGEPAQPRSSADAASSEPAAARMRTTGTEPVPLTPEVVQQTPPAGQTVEAVPAEVQSPAVREQTAGAGTARISIEFVAESWVEIRDRGGNVVLQVTGTPNTTRTVDGQPPFALTVGNAAGVRITYNQKPVDVAANASRNIARLTLE